MDSSYNLLVNATHTLKRHDVPCDLTECNFAFYANPGDPKRLLRKEAAFMGGLLFEAAKAEGLILYGASGYRSFERQEEIFAESLKNNGISHTLRYIARPGASEHQTGLALDVTCETLDFELEEAFAHTLEGIWLSRSAYLYGFILRYPKGKEKITGYAYEPWHIRYVTKPLAYYLRKTKLTLEEYHALP